ncbi:MAG: nucleoside triphosphate pyrophosphohydrolase family protein [Patescibacteria group bacterium]
MTFAEYQKESQRTALYPNKGGNYVYPTLGLAGETGEVAEKIKKIIRDKDGQIGNTDREELKKELGDVLWYIAQIATELGIDLENIAMENIKKLLSRLERGQIGGSGDNR